jgi:PAS domain-containing protein
MRQWELIGITDQVAQVPPVRRRAGPVMVGEAARGRPVFLWSTDTALRLRVVTSAAAEVIGLPASRCEGRDLIALFGIEGPNLAILEAHVAALNGHTTTFTLEGARETVRCRVAPTHDEADRVMGAMCLAIEVQDVDLRDIPELIAG